MLRALFAGQVTIARRPITIQDRTVAEAPDRCESERAIAGGAYTVRVLSVTVASMAWTCRACSRMNSKTMRVRGARCRRDG